MISIILLFLMQLPPCTQRDKNGHIVPVPNCVMGSHGTDIPMSIDYTPLFEEFEIKEVAESQMLLLQRSEAQLKHESEVYNAAVKMVMNKLNPGGDDDYQLDMCTKVTVRIRFNDDYSKALITRHKDTTCIPTNGGSGASTLPTQK